MEDQPVDTYDGPDGDSLFPELSTIDSDSPHIRSLPVITKIRPDPDDLREDMRGKIARWLIAILAFVVFATFGTIWFTDTPTTEIKDVLTVVVGPLATLVGAVTGFYYGERGLRK